MDGFNRDSRGEGEVATSVIYRLFTRGRRRGVHHFHGATYFLRPGKKEGGGVGIQIMGMEIAVDPSLLFHQALSNYGNYELRDERRSAYCDVRIEEVYRFEGRIRRSNRDRVRTRGATETSR